MSARLGRLMSIGNQAKKVGKKRYYTLTNAIFAALLDYFFDWSFDAEEGGSKWRGNLFLASNDPKGSKSDIDGAYHDLLILVLERRDSDQGKYVYIDCITMPARLLDPVMLVHTLKRAEVVDHGKYAAVEAPQGKTLPQLWHEFFVEMGFMDGNPEERFTMGELAEQMEDVLQTDAKEDVLREARKFLPLELGSRQAVA